MSTTPTLVSLYETDEEIHFPLCDDCAKDLAYQWKRFAELDDRCATCGKLNAVDVVAMPSLWTITGEDFRTWADYTARLEGGKL